VLKVEQANMTAINDLLTVMARLREPDYGCPWDQVQTYRSIAPSTLEEAYEVVDAIEQGDSQQLKEELGDLLFQVIFYSEIGKEDQAFTFDDIAAELTAKLIRRHPHVFPEGTLESRISPSVTPENRRAMEREIKQSWEATKQQEREAKGCHSVMDDVPIAFPGLLRAQKLQKRAASVGFDWSDINGVYQKLSEEVDELKEELKTAGQANNLAAIEDELGDVMFTLVNLARHLKIDAETACRKSSQKFESRFRIMESQALSDNVKLSSLEEQALDARWEIAKRKLMSATVDKANSAE
jgi:nucleoside triphosphate diphosphatase